MPNAYTEEVLQIIQEQITPISDQILTEAKEITS
jgi:hypothetical protein